MIRGDVVVLSRRRIRDIRIEVVETGTVEDVGSGTVKRKCTLSVTKVLFRLTFVERRPCPSMASTPAFPKCPGC
jgi:hypothetical protein